MLSTSPVARTDSAVQKLWRAHTVLQCVPTRNHQLEAERDDQRRGTWNILALLSRLRKHSSNCRPRTENMTEKGFRCRGGWRGIPIFFFCPNLTHHPLPSSPFGILQLSLFLLLISGVSKRDLSTQPRPSWNSLGRPCWLLTQSEASAFACRASKLWD